MATILFPILFLPFLPHSDDRFELQQVVFTSSRCIELLPCDWMICNLFYQAIDQVYLIKWLVSVYICIYVCMCIKICVIYIHTRVYFQRWFCIIYYNLYYRKYNITYNKSNLNIVVIIYNYSLNNTYIERNKITKTCFIILLSNKHTF